MHAAGDKVRRHECSDIEESKSFGPRAEPNMIQAARTIKQHADSTDDNIHPRDAQMLERSVANYRKRLFLES